MTDDHLTSYSVSLQCELLKAGDMFQSLLKWGILKWRQNSEKQTSKYAQIYDVNRSSSATI